MGEQVSAFDRCAAPYYSAMVVMRRPGAEHMLLAALICGGWPPGTSAKNPIITAPADQPTGQAQEGR